MSLRQALVEQYKCQVKICWEMNENFGQYAMPKKCKYLKFVDDNGILKQVEVDIHERKRLEDLLECALAELEPVCLVEQEFCVAFFALDQGGHEADDSSSNNKTPERSINEEVRKMMSVLFTVLEPELVSFLATYEKVDSL